MDWISNNLMEWGLKELPEVTSVEYLDALKKTSYYSSLQVVHCSKPEPYIHQGLVVICTTHQLHGKKSA
jgi:hypothetical protein